MVVAAVLVAMAYSGAAMCLNQLVLQVSSYLNKDGGGSSVSIAIAYSCTAKCQI